jgi:NitT/TauT family transport system substrate-binding protein/sulfonate transport system substrate-binding protein
MEALPAKQWVLGGTGGSAGGRRLALQRLHGGLGNDESITNTFMSARTAPFSRPKLQQETPEVYGSPETVKGKTVLVTTVSSVHYSMSTWLGVWV